MLKKLFIVSIFNILIITNLNGSFFELKQDFNSILEKEKLKEQAFLWMHKQIQSDISRAKKAGYSFDINFDLQKWFNNEELAVRYKVKDGKLEICKSSAQLDEVAQVDRLMRMNNIFITLSKLVKLPDFDIIVSLEDCINGDGSDIPGVILAAAKNKNLDKNVLLMPDFQILDVYPNLIEQVQAGNLEYAWENKKDQAFWIGATTGGFYNKANKKTHEGFLYTKENYKKFARIKIVDLSFKFPELLYARLNYLVQMKDDLKPILQDYVANHISIKDHMQYKYQVALDGNGVSSSRLYWQLFSNSVLLKQDTNSIRWYHNALVKYKHYIPVKNDLSNLIDQINWAKAHDKEVQQISINANDFAVNNLKLSDNLYYLYNLLKEVSKLQKSN